MKKPLKYCPQCGNPSLQWDGEKRWSCPECGFTLYHNCAAAVAVLITHGDEILFTQRNQEPEKGLLDLSGGFVDPKESAENTCKRELKEELNLDISPRKLRYLTSMPNTYLYKDILYHTLDLFYHYELDERPVFELEKSEISSTVWIKKSDIILNDIAFESQKNFFSSLPEYLP